MALTLLFFLLLSSSAAVQPVVPAPQSEPVTLTLGISDDRRQFRPGEIIPIELAFDSTAARRFVVDGATYDRSGRLTIDEFRLDPLELVIDPMADYFASVGGYFGGGLRSTGVLGGKPFTVKLQLNEWFRFERPGIFRLSIRSTRVTDEDRTANGRHPIVPVESNTVEFEILSRDTDWEAAEIRAALSHFDSKPFDMKFRDGCRMLRFLATEAAVDEMIHRYGTVVDSGCDFDYMTGLFAAPNRAYVVHQMENGLRAADQPVTTSYLRTLAILSVYVQHPEFRASQANDTKGRLIAGGELSRHPDLVDAAQSIYADILSAAVPDKTERARAITLVERFGSQPRGQATRDSATSRGAIAATFLELPGERQVSLLDFQWRTIAGSAMIPVLRQLVDSPAASFRSTDLALRRLYQLSPAETRPLMLREIRHPRAGATLKTLGQLPDVELPELDDVLAANFERSRDSEAGGDFEDEAVRAQLIHRYASKNAASRVLRSAEERLTHMACDPQAALLAYFLRVDPEVGKTLLARALAASREPNSCRTSFSLIAALRMTRALEAIILQHLDDPALMRSAVETLGPYGSSVVQAPLRRAFEQWHHAWEGRAEELEDSHARERPNAAQGMIEAAFLQSLARGRAWFAGRADLEELRALCVTDNCRTQASIMIQSADDMNISLLRVDEPSDSIIYVGQYQLTSIDALEQKLLQYPAGVTFTLQTTSLDPQSAAAVAAEITRFGNAHGIRIKGQ